MKIYRCSLTVEDEIEADTPEEAQKEFLRTVDQVGASYYNLESDVEVEELND